MTINESWARVSSWLQHNAPATAARVRPTAGHDAAAAAEASFPEAWTADLREWYSLHDGEVMEVLWRCVLPHWQILPLEDVVSESEMWTGFADDTEQIGPTTAGEMAFSFLPQFVPIGSDGCGNSLFVDLRPGPLHGCVTEYSPEDPTSEPTWSSVSHMLDELASSLETGRDCDGWTPSVIDGELSWSLADAE